MKLQSVQALKADLLSVPDSLLEGVASAASFRAFTNRRETADRAMTGVALGVGRRSKTDYVLAIRLQQTGPLVSAVTDQLRDRARGEVDVRFVGNIAKFQTGSTFYRKHRRPLRIGASMSDVADEFVSAGTLGCFVVGRRSPHYIGILTNNHVIAAENDNSAGAPVVQPGTLDGGQLSRAQIGALGKFIRLKPRGVNYVDAALCDLFEGIDYDATQVGDLGNLSGQVHVQTLPPKATVHKVGRTTGQRTGRITAFDVDNVQVEYDMGWLRFDNQIEIEGTGNRAFSDSGDSGSLIVDEQLRAIGLLFAGGDEGGSNGKGLTYANPIEVVLEKLQVDLER